MVPPPDYNIYEQEWKKVDSLANRGLPKSALELVEKIYSKAKNENNHPQFIKATLYKIKLKADFEEDFIENIIKDLNTEIDESITPDKQILHSIIADLYWRYYQANRYKFLERTTTGNFDNTDIKTWDLKILLNAVIKNYLASLEHPDELKRTDLKSYDVILETTEESKNYRPTLYDFLAHRAVDFFINDESSIIQPAYKFELDNEEYFTGASKFIKLKIETKDTLSLKFYATQILQNLIDFHLNDKTPVAFIDVDLKRLNFVRQNSVIENKDSLYLKSLINLEKKYIDFPSSADVSYEIAKEYQRSGAGYNPLESDKHKWDVKKAYEVCEEAIRRFPDSDGAKNCKVVQQQIEKADLHITTENVNSPEKYSLALVDYKNISKLYFRIVQLDYEQNRELKQTNQRKEDIVRKYLSFPYLQSWDLEIPDDGDFQHHATEIKIPELPLGYYILLASTTENFSLEQGSISYGSFWMSNISYITQKTTKDGYRFYILDRETGNPLKNTQAQIFYRQYDYNTRNYEYKQGGSFNADAEGYFEIPALESNAKPNSFFLEFTLKNDRLITEEQFYHAGYYPREEKKETKTFFFTDRAIYRPGQTIYFKGIVLEKLKDNYEIKPGYKTTVTFFDVNHQKISEVELVTNDYGSFNGSFTAPTGVLNGKMTISDKSGSVIITVEEYKRPKFEVVFEAVTGSYKLNEIVNITGKAQAFSGNNIDNARVRYSVVRKVFYPYRYFGFWDFIPFPETSSMEITNGETMTDEYGKFSISFKAISDNSVSSSYKPVFNYTVYADVTDINGETQSSETTVSVGYTALFIDLGVKDIVDKAEFKKIKLKTTNLNGMPQPAKGKIIISKLKEPDRLFIDRQWKVPDIFIYSKEEFYSDFPHSMYKEEGNINKLEVESIVATFDFDTEADSIIRLNDVSDWEQGRYSAEVQTTDSYGETVELKKYFILFSAKDKIPPVNKIDWFHTIKNKGEPGEKAAFIIGTKDRNVSVLYEVVHKDKVISKQWLKLHDEQKVIEIPILEKYRGGFAVNLIFVKYNRSFNNSFRVDVPFTNKELVFEFETFRNKLIPGQKEEWKIKIKGKKGDSLTAELLASMYDASLDVFTPHNWNFNLYRKQYGSLFWQTSGAFSTGHLKIFSAPVKGWVIPVFKEYDRLNWFGFNYYGAPFYREGFAKNGEMVEATAIPGQAHKMAGDAIVDKSVEEEEFIDKGGKKKEQVQGLQIRRDFRETAFFYPALQTNENGEVIISFTAPESLTRWNLMGLAYTKDLKYGQFEKEIITQKDLMVIPNPPRFFRVGDTISFAAKVVNLSDVELTGEAKMQFFNTRTMKDITSLLVSDNTSKAFMVSKGKSQMLDWDISIPEGIDVITYRITAYAGNFSDGEEKAIPVLTNRMLVTESLPLPVNGKETKTFKFEKLLNSSLKKGVRGITLRPFKLTLEFSSNPAWYAVQALPYIMETEFESADHIFSRYYANSIASYLVNSKPGIKQVFDTWKNFTPDALLSNLEKNEELKSVILQETPWVLEAENETERKQRVALLFDLNKMSDEMTASLRKLKQKQSPNGGWPWFKGMRESRNITQNIVTGFAHLKQLGVANIWEDTDTRQMLGKAIRYLDQKIREDYEKLKQRNPDEMDKNHLSRIQIQYLYARSYFMGETAIAKSTEEAFNYYMEQSKKYWLDYNKYLQGMIALALNRLYEKSIPLQILASIKEHALYSEEMGMYWRDNLGGYYWYQAPVETQALLIEAFDEITNDKEAVEQMKIWLLKQKQTQDWKTSKATAEAVYALLLKGSDWLANTELAEIKIGNEVIDPLKLDDTKVEAGTGYFKTSWSGSDIKQEMGEITVTNKNESIAWGAVYWQYFENLDKITQHDTPLKLEKKLFIERNTDAGPVIEPVTENTLLKVGDKIKVRLELRVDRNLEYVHMKDMRASTFEPVNVLSGYKYQGGLGYYESTLDASVNFFFNYLRNGTYVFEYPLVVSQKGDFSNGITTIQCMYAPEFTSHSEGVRVMVVD